MQICKICKLEKEATFVKVGKNGGFLYADNEGKLWKGKVCNDCQNKRRVEQRKAKKNPE